MASRNGKRYRLVIVATHPVQYYAPWFAHLSEQIDLEVWYAYRQDPRGQAAAGFGVDFDWDVPLLDGYRHRWLTNVARRPGVGHFSGCDTPEISSLLGSKVCDAVLVLGWNRKSLLQAAFAARRRGIPLLMRGDSQLATRRSVLRRGMKYIPYRCLLPAVEAHLYVGRRNREYLRHYGVPDSRLFFTPHFVDAPRFRETAEKSRLSGGPVALRSSLSIPQDAFVTLFVGKLIPKKRPEDFVNAIRLLSEQLPGQEVHGVLVGDGRLRMDLEKKAEAAAGRVHFAGFRNQCDLPRFYAASDVLVLPSDGRETWGLVVNEAAACGVPSVVSEAAGCAPDMVEEGETGFTYPTGNASALADRLRASCHLLRRARAGVERALREKSATYSMEQASRGLLRALASVA